MLDATQRSSVIFSAYAKLPAGITAYEVHKVIGVVVEIDMHTGRILQAECTLATKLASDFIAKMLVGYNMNDGLDELNAMIEKHYQASAKKAFLASCWVMVLPPCTSPPVRVTTSARAVPRISMPPCS